MIKTVSPRCVLVSWWVPQKASPLGRPVQPWVDRLLSRLELKRRQDSNFGYVNARAHGTERYPVYSSAAGLASGTPSGANKADQRDRPVWTDFLAIGTVDYELSSDEHELGEVLHRYAEDADRRYWMARLETGVGEDLVKALPPAGVSAWHVLPDGGRVFAADSKADEELAEHCVKPLSEHGNGICPSCGARGTLAHAGLGLAAAQPPATGIGGMLRRWLGRA